MTVDIETIGVAVDSSGVKSGTSALDAFGRSADSASRKADSFGSSSAKAGKETQELGRMADVASSLLGRLTIALGAVAGLAGIAKQLDDYTRFTAQIKLATNGVDEYRQALSSVNRIANEAQAPLGAVGVLYARLTNNLREFGTSQKQIASISETVALALKVQGASTEEASAAMLQLSQAFGKGRLDGDELRTMLEAAPNLMRQLAQSIGVPYGALKDLGEQGLLTNDKLIKAFTDSKYLEALRQSAQEVQTIGGAWQSLKNVALDAIGTISEKTGLARLFAEGIKGIASALQLLIDTAKAEPIDYNKFLPNHGQSLIVEGYVPGGVRGIPAKGPIANDRPSVKYGQVGGDLGSINIIPRVDIGTIQEAQAEVKKLKAEMDKFREDNPLKDSISKLEEYNAKIKQLTDLESKGLLTTQEATRYRAQFTEELNKGKKAVEDFSSAEMSRMKQLLEADEREIEAAKRQLENQSKAIDAMAREAAGWKDLTEVQQVSWEIQSGRYRDFDEQSKEELLRLAGIIDLKKEQVELDKQDAELMKQLRAAEDEAVDETIRRIKKEQEAYQKMADNINRAITDSLMRGFERGKSFAQNFRDTLVNMFKTLILQPTISYILSPVSNAVASVFGTQSSSGGSGSSLNSASSLLSAGKTIWQGFSGGLSAGLGSVVAGLGSAFGSSTLTSLGSSIAGQMLGTAAGMGPTVAGAATGIGSMASSIGSLGSAISTAMPYIGAAMAAFSLLGGGVFGSHVSRPKWYANTLVSDSSATTRSVWGNSDASGANQAAAPGLALAQVVQAMTHALGGRIGDQFNIGTKYEKKYNALGVVVGSEITKKNREFDIDMGSESARANGAAMTFFSAVNKGLISMDGYLKEIISRSNIDMDHAAAAVNSLATLKSMRDAAKDLPAIFKSIAWTIEHSADVDSVETMKKHISSISTYVDLFYSDGEKLSYTAKELQKQFSSLGVAFPKTESDFRKLVDGIDTTTKSGVDLFDTLTEMAPQMSNYYKALQAQKDSTTQAAEAANQLANSLSTDKFKTLVDYLRAQSYIKNNYSTVGIPGFASGGDFSGGLRIVGENGPELEATGPSRITNTNELMSRLRDPQANNAAVVAELKALRSDMRSMQIAQTIANQKTAKILDKFDNDGLPPTRT